MKFKLPQKFKLSTLLYNKKFTVTLSVVLAFALWLGIAMTENTVRKESFDNLSATVSLEGTAAEKLGLGIFSDVSAQRFTVTVEGPNHIVSSLKAEDFVLSASTFEISGAKTYDLHIGVENTSNKSGYTIVSIEPSTIEVTVDYVVSSDYDVIPKIVGAKPGEGLVWEDDDLKISETKHEKINITGPRTKMEKIKKVYAVAETNETLSESKTFDANIVLCDENDEILYKFGSDGTVLDSYNNPINNSFLTLSFKSTKFMVEVSKQKTIKCEPVFTNLPDGLTAEDINYTISINVPSDDASQETTVKNELVNNELTIQGEPETVDKLEKLLLTPIDFSEVSVSENSFEVMIQELPNKVTVVENPVFFTVDIDVSEYREKTIVVNNVDYIGLGDHTAKLDKEQLSVKVCGPADTIRDIRAKDLRLVYDLTGKIPGKYEVVPVIKSDVYDKIWIVGKNKVFVTLT